MRIRAKQTVVVRVYPLVRRAVEEGVRWGLHRARKHADGDPGDDVLAEHLVREVLQALSEILDYGDDDR